MAGIEGKPEDAFKAVEEAQFAQAAETEEEKHHG